MAVFEISRTELQDLDAKILKKIVIPSVPCDHCRQAITFRIVRLGSVTEHLPTISNKARKLARSSALITLTFDAVLITGLLHEQHISQVAICPHCSETLTVEIFLTPTI
jgi:hypothetical protein